MDSLPRRIVLTVVIAAALVFGITAFESSAPSAFPAGYSVNIPKGTTLSEVADYLKSHNLIRSETLFKLYATFIEKTTTGIKTGDYLFTGAQSAYDIAYRLVKGLEGYPVVKITIPEGSSSADIAAIISKQVPDFDSKDFLAQAASDEGYLFPETYFWPTNVKPADVISDMHQEFTSKISTIQADLASSTRSQADIIKMAAILEREATSSADRRIVAGILWKRIDAGIPLQVDAPFEYFLHKSSADLTTDDLAKPSPYNLYLHTGLGPTPIANPGLDAIRDAANPATTKYWYYLSDKHGVLHYAETLEGHAANKNKYLQ